MPSNSTTSEEYPFLDIAVVENRDNTTFSEFSKACQFNDVSLALQLASEQDTAALTCGLNDAIDWRRYDLARQLLLSGAHWDTSTVRYASKSFDAIKLLIDFGFNVNTCVLGGGTLLSHAVPHNDWLSIQFILMHGANPNLGPPRPSRGPRETRLVSNSGGILNEAAAYCTPQVFALLLEHGAVLSNSIALHYAAGRPKSVPPGDRIPMMEYLLGLGVDINEPDDIIQIAEDGRGRRGTPLMYALSYARVAEVQWLLEHGADPDKRTSYGDSAMDLAIRRFPPEHKLLALLRQYRLKDTRLLYHA